MDPGLGPITPDGSPVEVYRRLPLGREAEFVDGATVRGSEILELGCGTGRVTHRLIEMGHRVTAVDDSAEMLSHVRGAKTVLARIEDLALGKRFDCVVLGSHLVNEADDERRRAFLDTCRRHVSPLGCVLIERYEPGFDWRAREGIPAQLGDVSCTLWDVRVDGDRLDAVMEYAVEGRVWRQPFSAVLLGDDDLERELEVSGLRLESWLDERRSWLMARPVR